MSVEEKAGVSLEVRGLPFKRAAAVLGFAILGFGLWMLRYWDSVPSFLHRDLGVPIREWRLGFPPTFVPACLILLLGSALLIWGQKWRLKDSSNHLPARIPAFFDGRPWGLYLWLQGSALICLLLAALEYTEGLAKFPLAPFFWLSALVWGAVYFCRLDRKRGIEVTLGLSARERLFLLLVSTAGLIYWLHDVASWKYIMVGDEYGFLWSATRLLGESWWQWNPLEAKGVYGDNPVMNTVFLALFLQMFGVSVYSWNFCSAVMMITGVPLLYVFARREGTRWTGAVAVVVFICSTLVTAHAKIGYPNGSMILPIVSAISFLALARKGSALHAFLAGLGAGFGAFLVMVGWLVATAYLAIALTLEWTTSAQKKRVLTKVSLVVAGWVLGAFPILMQFDYFTHLFSKNVGQKLATETMAGNTVKALFAFLSFRSPSRHYVYGEAADIVTAVLIVAGIAFAFKNRRSRLLVLIVVSIFFSATISKYDYLPVTRFHVVAVPWAVLAGLGATWLMQLFRQRRLQQSLVFSVTLAIFFLNLKAWKDVENWLMTDVHYVAHYFQEIALQERGIHLVPERWNTDTENDGMKLAGLEVRALKDSDSTEFFNTGVRQSPEDWVVFVHPSVILPKATVNFLIRHEVPVFVSRSGRYRVLDMNPEPLDSSDIRSFDRPRPDPKRPVNPVEQDFIASRIKAFEPLAEDEEASPGLWLTCYDRPYWRGAVTCGESVDTVFVPSRQAGKAHQYSALWRGLFTPSESGNYRFSITSDDGSFLVLDGRLLLDNLGPHPKETVAEMLELETARPILLELGYFQLGGDSAMELSIELIPPEGDPTPITQFSHVPRMRGALE